MLFRSAGAAALAAFFGGESFFAAVALDLVSVVLAVSALSASAFAVVALVVAALVFY